MRSGVVTALLFSVLAGSTVGSTAWGQVTRRISLGSGNSQGTNHSSNMANAVSGDGRFVVFQSDAPNLVPGDTNARRDVFVRDRLTGTTTRVSVSSTGVQGNENSHSGAISRNGRFVAFRSTSSTLVPGDTNGVQDVFVHDRTTGVTTRVSVATGGVQAGVGSPTLDQMLDLSLSDDGRFLAFSSQHTDLVPGDTNASGDAFVHDRSTQTTTRVSVSSTGAQGNGISLYAAISIDGRYVLFDSSASNLESGDTNGIVDVFLHDRDLDADGILDETHAGARQTTIVSRGSLGERGNNMSFTPSVTADANQYFFTSFASNLVPGDTNAHADVFRRTRAGVTTRVSVDWQGMQLEGGWPSSQPAVSGDGRFVAFSSQAHNLLPGISPRQSYDDLVWVRDLTTGQNFLGSPKYNTPSGTGGEARNPTLATDGRTVAWTSELDEMIPGDTNLVTDVFVRTIGPDGSADWESIQVAVQDTQTSLGDSTLGSVTSANGSELDGAYASVEGGYLLLTLTGNLDLSTAALHVFVDAQSGGQNRLRSNNPVVGANNALVRMGDSGSGNGLRFDAGFEADYYLGITGAGPGTVSFASLPSNGAGIARVLGTIDVLSPGVLANDNPDGILCTYNNSNTVGVNAGTSTSTGAGVRTGVEFAIPLASIGNPQCGIRVSAFLTNTTFSTVSNQVLGPLGGRAALGEPRNVNLGSIPRNQFFEAVPQLSTYASLRTPSPQTDVNFGRAIAIRAGQALIGARRFDRPGANDAGAIFTSAKVGGAWTAPVEILPATLPAAGDRLGWSIAYDQNWAFVGSPNRDSAGADAGAVWVFERTGTNAWVQRAILTAPDAQAGANFGYSVDLLFDRAIIGAPNHDGVGVDSGKAYVYARTGSGWVLQGQLTASDGAAGDQFGFDVAISILGTEVVVGAPGDDRAGLTNAGAAYMFRRTGTSWPSAFHRRWEASDAVSNQRFGAAVALSTAFAAVGAPDTAAGAVYPIYKSGSTWNSTHGVKITPPDGVTGDLFGIALAASNTQLAVGAPNSGQPFFDCGVVYAYGFGSGTLYSTAKVTAPDAAAGDALGGDVAIDGTTLAAGAGGFDIGGTAYAFDLAAAAPVVTEIPPDGTHALGTSITLTWTISTPSPATVRVFFDGGVELTTSVANAGLATINYPLFITPGVGGEYWIEIETACQTTQSARSTIITGPGPSNDECSGAILLNPGDYVTANTAYANPDLDLPARRAGVAPPSPSSSKGVWYKFIGTGHQMVLSTCYPDTNYDTVLEVLCDNQCAGTYYSIVWDDDSASCGFNRASEVTLCTVPGASYLVRVSGFGATSGTFGLSLTDYPGTCGEGSSAFRCTPQGACCAAGSCSVTLQGWCTERSGTWEGAHSNCVRTTPQVHSRSPAAALPIGVLTTDSIVVPDAFDFAALAVSVNIQGDARGAYLDVFLRKGAHVVQVWNWGCGQQGISATFRNTGVTVLPCDSTLVTEPLRPYEPLDFTGQPSAGTWTLEIQNSDVSPGQLVSWSLAFDRITSPASACACHGSCIADFDDGSGTGVPDEGVTIDDLLYYLQIFELGDLCADVDDGSFTGATDDGVTIDDLLYYLFRFESGC